MWCTCPLTTRRMYTDIPWACGLGSIRGGDLRPLHFVRLWLPDRAILRLRLGMAWTGRRMGISRRNLLRRPSLCLPQRSEFITTPPLCTEIIEDSLPRMAHSAHSYANRDAHGFGSAAGRGYAVTDMRAHLEATRGRPTASPAVIVEQPQTGARQRTEPTPATGDSPAADMLAMDTADGGHSSGGGHSGGERGGKRRRCSK